MISQVQATFSTAIIIAATHCAIYAVNSGPLAYTDLLQLGSQLQTLIRFHFLRWGLLVTSLSSRCRVDLGYQLRCLALFLVLLGLAPPH